MIRRIAISVLLLSLSAPVATSAEEEGSVFLWKAHKDGATVYLLGSIHALKEDAYPLPAVIETAFDGVDSVAFEVDIDSMAGGAFKMLAAGSLGSDQTLEEVVGPALWQQFSSKMTENGFPPSMFQSMKPWMAALSLAALEFQRAGYSESAGIDSHFWRRAEEGGKKRIALETVEFQIGLFAGFSEFESVEMLRYTLADLETLIPQLDELHARWLVGDADFIASTLGEEFEEFPSLYERLVTNRNRAWLPAIEELLAGSGDAMVVVGALHMVGKDGLVELLRARGYTVTQM